MINIDPSMRFWIDGLDGIVACIGENGRKICLADEPDGSRDFFECNGENPPILIQKHWIGRRTQGNQGAVDQYETKRVLRVVGYVTLLTLEEWRMHGHKSWDELVMWVYENDPSWLSDQHTLPRHMRRSS
ncbi:MAG TPA: hypothetical protein VNE61_01725 [Ktedonobacteraceae bacterium]|nr:hypothetical protein [Ktedonobacteraceae bacterium]